MRSELFKRLRRWEEEDKAEEITNARLGRIEKLKISNARADVFLAFGIITSIFCVGVIILNVAI